MSGIRAVNAIRELQKFSDENDSSSTVNNIMEKTREELLLELDLLKKQVIKQESRSRMYKASWESVTKHLRNNISLFKELQTRNNFLESKLESEKVINV